MRIIRYFFKKLDDFDIKQLAVFLQNFSLKHTLTFYNLQEHQIKEMPLLFLCMTLSLRETKKKFITAHELTYS